jgi:Uroporphyrinogen decarboxylase (URO-D)
LNFLWLDDADQRADIQGFPVAKPKTTTINPSIMRLNVAVVCLTSAVLTGTSSAFSISSSSSSPSTTRRTTRQQAAATDVDSAAAAINAKSSSTDPLLIRAAKGQVTERTPVWMMRQAGRHIKEYRELVKTYPTFRERSEIADVAVEISLQPWRNYQTDGCILFSDILTPLPGMGVDFAIDEKVGPVMEPIRTYEEAKKVSDGGPLMHKSSQRPFWPDRRR